MSQAVETYLDRVMLYAHIKDATRAATIRAEQKDHLEEKVEQLKADGMPIEDAVFAAIEAHGHPRTVGYGLRPKWSWIDIRSHGTARGFIAMGPRAVGVFAFGGTAMGVVTFSGVGLGVVSMGGLVGALFFGWAGVSFVPSGLAFAGIAIGAIAVGGVAIGAAAAGALTVGLWASGGLVISQFPVETIPSVPQTILGYVSHPPGFACLYGIVIAIFTLLTIFNIVAHQREQQRLHRADPKLVE